MKSKEKPVAIAYFKRTQGRHSYLQIVSYCKLMSDGRVYNINLTRMTTSTTYTFGSLPLTLEAATKSEWDKAFKKITNHINNGKQI